jgi:threonine dehydrogenase-like Zn-dependent dehydrogenase
MAGMRAAVFHGERRIGVVDIARPDGLSGAVMLRVCRTALCDSDGKLWIKGAQWTPGHEIFGVVEQPGHSFDGQRFPAYIPVRLRAVHGGRAGQAADGLLKESTSRNLEFR